MQNGAQRHAAGDDCQGGQLSAFFSHLFLARPTPTWECKAGQTVAATIPAAVIAMALFRIPAFRGGILEQNITRTAASVGEALVAGAIFTIPAFMMVELDGQRLWSDLRSHYWEATLVLLVGGLIGVFFIILAAQAAMRGRAAAVAGKRRQLRDRQRPVKLRPPKRPATSSAPWVLAD